MSSRTKASQGTILETNFRTHFIKIVLEKDGSVNAYSLHIGALAYFPARKTRYGQACFNNYWDGCSRYDDTHEYGQNPCDIIIKVLRG
jgi:hypothetical protein